MFIASFIFINCQTRDYNKTVQADQWNTTNRLPQKYNEAKDVLRLQQVTGIYPDYYSCLSGKI
jgi:hypothetical protein